MNAPRLAAPATIDVEISRAHLVSQWPMMFGEWMERGGPFVRIGKALAGVALAAAIFAAPLTLVDIVPTWAGWAALAVALIVAPSFMFSVHGRPRGVFWVAALIERACPPKRHAARDRAAAPARRRHTASPRLPAPGKAKAA